MTQTKKPAPQTIADAELDQTSGGVLIGLLLPAVQKSPEAARPDPRFKGGVFVGAADFDGDGKVDGADY